MVSKSSAIIIAPFGGVYKYKDPTVLDKLEFKGHRLHPVDDMQNDLRGFLPQRNLPKLVRWFKKRKEDRETADECLTREFSEEVREAKLNKIRCPQFIPFQLVRRVQEGPEKVLGQPYMQYRIFNIYKIDESKTFAKQFKTKLLAAARRGAARRKASDAGDSSTNYLGQRSVR